MAPVEHDAFKIAAPSDELVEAPNEERNVKDDPARERVGDVGAGEIAQFFTAISPAPRSARPLESFASADADIHVLLHAAELIFDDDAAI